MTRLVTVLVRAANGLAVALFAALVVCMFVSVAIRFLGVWGGSLSWIEEFANFSFIWLTFLGAIVALDRGKHIVIGLLVERLPDGPRRALAIAVHLVILAFLAVVVVKGGDLVRRTMEQLSPSFDLPIGLVYAVLPASAAVMVLQVVASLRDELAGRRADGPGR